MPKLPRLTGAEIRGSHHVMESGERRTTVPVHGSKILRIGTLQGILRDVEIAPGVFAAIMIR